MRSIPKNRQGGDFGLISYLGWRTREKASKSIQDISLNQIAEIKAETEFTYNRIAQLGRSGGTELISGYEEQIIKNKAAIAQIQADTAKPKYLENEFQTATTNVINFIKKPISQWETGNLSKQRTLLNMYFLNKMSYDRETGFQTADLPLMLAISQHSQTSKIQMVDIVKNNLQQLEDWIMRCYGIIKAYESI